MAKLQSVLEQYQQEQAQGNQQEPVSSGLPSFSSYADLLGLVYGKDTPYIIQLLDSPQADRNLSNSVKSALNKVQNYVTALRENAQGLSSDTTASLTQSIKNAVSSAVNPAFQYEQSMRAQLQESQNRQTQTTALIKNSDKRLKETQKAIEDATKNIGNIDKQIDMSNKGVEANAIAAIKERLKTLAKQGYADTGNVSQLTKAREGEKLDKQSTDFLEQKVFPVTREFNIPDAVAATQWAVEGGRKTDNAIHNVFGLGPNIAYPSIEDSVKSYANTVTNILKSKGYDPEKLKGDPEAFLNALQDPKGVELAPGYLSAQRYEGHNQDPYEYVRTTTNTPEYRAYGGAQKTTPILAQGSSKQSSIQNVLGAETIAKPVYAGAQTMKAVTTPAQNTTSYSRAVQQTQPQQQAQQPQQQARYPVPSYAPPATTPQYGPPSPTKTSTSSKKSTGGTVSKGIMDTITSAVKNLFGIK